MNPAERRQLHAQVSRLDARHRLVSGGLFFACLIAGWDACKIIYEMYTKDGSNAAGWKDYLLMFALVALALRGALFFRSETQKPATPLTRPPRLPAGRG